MIMFGSSLPSALGWLVTTKVYSGTGADIVMESIAPIDLGNRDFECSRDFGPTVQHDASRPKGECPFLIQSSTWLGSDFRNQTRTSFLLSQYSKKAPSAAFATATAAWFRT